MGQKKSDGEGIWAHKQRNVPQKQVEKQGASACQLQEWAVKGIKDPHIDVSHRYTEV